MWDSLKQAFDYAKEILQLKQQVKVNTLEIQSLEEKVNRLTEINRKLLLELKYKSELREQDRQHFMEQQEKDRENFRLTIENLQLKLENKLTGFEARFLSEETKQD